MAAILNFQIFCKNCKTQKCLLKTVLDRADYADFGCHNSIRLEAEHFLNTLALTFISFSGRFVFAVQKHCLFFASDPVVVIFIERKLPCFGFNSFPSCDWPISLGVCNKR